MPEFLFLVRFWGFVPSIGLPTLVRFVPFFPFGRSFLPPLSVITSHALSASFVVAIFLFRPFLFAPLRFAFFKVEKRNRPLFFQRWLFLHSLSGCGTPTADFIIFSRYFATRSPCVALYVASLSLLRSVVVPPPSLSPRGFIAFTAPPLRKFRRTSSIPHVGRNPNRSKPLQKKHHFRFATLSLFWRCFF